MSVEKITTHIVDALERLIEQYKSSPNLRAIISSFVDQIQDLEDGYQSIIEAHDIYNAFGDQLDQIGTIVGQERLGLPDDFYRILILVKIGQNISNSEPERVIDTFKLITQASRVHLQELFPAGVYLMSDGDVNPVTVDFLYSVIQDVVAAGVRVDFMGKWDPDCAFAFDGDPGSTQGFGTVTDANIGGCLAELYQITIPFAFNSDDNTSLGFGSVKDPVLGGAWVGL